MGSQAQSVGAIRANAFLVLLDSDGDGAITRKEVLSVFEALDADQDGTVTDAESAPVARARMFIGPYDTNHDRGLSKNEVKEPLWSRLSSGDANADGVLSEAEFMAFLPAAPRGPVVPTTGIPAGHPKVGQGAANPDKPDDHPAAPHGARPEEPTD